MTIDDVLSRISPSLHVLTVQQRGPYALEITLESDAILDKQTIDRVHSELSNAISGLAGCGGVKCNVEIRYPNAMELLINNPEALNVAKKAAVAMCPVLDVVFRYSRFIVENGTLCLYVPDKLMEAISTSLERHLRDTFYALYGVQKHAISIFTDTSLKLPEIKKPEVVRIAPVAAAQPKSLDTVIMGRTISKQSIPMCDVGEDAGKIVVKGALQSYEEKARKGGGYIVSFSISDFTYTIPVKIFLGGEEKDKSIRARIQQCKETNHNLIVRGDFHMDTYTGQMCLFASDISCEPVQKRMDTAEYKRVELHLHTQFSAMDALLTAADKENDAVETAARFGHKAVAITDHGVVHGFPSAVKIAEKKGIKAILGVEGYLVDDSDGIDVNYTGSFIALAFTLERLESTTNVRLAALLFNGMGERNDTLYAMFSYPSRVIMKDEDAVLHILQYGSADASALEQISAACKDAYVVVHGADEYERLTKSTGRFKVYFPQEHVDSKLLIHHLLHDELKDTSLRYACEHLGILAKTDEELIMQLMLRIIAISKQRNAQQFPLMHGFGTLNVKGHSSGTSHIILLAKNAVGLKNLYKMVSWGHLEYFKKVPRIPRSLLMLYRSGIILGSACEAGELFHAVLAQAIENPPGIADKIRRIAQFYDYLEIQPIGNNEFLVRDGRIADADGLRELNRRIVELGEDLNLPVVATGDVHFLEPADAVFRAILMHSKGFSDADKQSPLYFKTTDEMLVEFAYLGEAKAFEVVVTNTNRIADMCESLKPFLSEKHTYAPAIEGAEDELKTITYNTAYEIYGNPLPDAVQKRLDKELNSIIGNDYCSLYLMAMRLVNKSMSDGYLVGSRGSVGSSFVAYLMRITEVNPLQPHYVCPNCKYSDFDVGDVTSRCGIDLPDRECPVCRTQLEKLGFEIPFETFLGFKGDKTPDIDLNFSGEYQSVAHAYVEEMFGVGHAFRAGTISAVQEKTAYGYVKKYFEDKNIRVCEAEMQRLSLGCSGVKRTTGQHPGGIVIVPQEYDIYDFTPVQLPADKQCATSITTHFDFHAMDDRLVKLDILGHDDPTALRMLSEMTGIDPKSIPLDDESTMKLFSSLEPFGISLDKLSTAVGSIAIPEFGTKFVRQILKETRPTTIEELVRIAGLSHGTNVWKGNAQDLVLGGVATLSQAICTRDDIMSYLISMGGEPSLSFKIMESVRKGNGLTTEMEQLMVDIGVPTWYIESCKKIKYMFPRAHAAAYVMMSFRIAYYKLHYPTEFYATYFTVRADAFDFDYAFGGANAVLANIAVLQKEADLKNAESKNADSKNSKADVIISVLEVVYEMNLRGIELLPLDLYKSQATEFVIEGNALRPPFVSLSGVGETAAKELAAAHDDNKPFVSIEDFAKRSHANNTTMQQLKRLGLFNGLSERNQLSMFDVLDN